MAQLFRSSVTEVMRRRSSTLHDATGGLVVDDVEDATHEMFSDESVYSFFLFVIPLESSKDYQAAKTPRSDGSDSSRKEQPRTPRGLKGTSDTWMAGLLVCLNLAFQGILLYAVWNAVVVSNMSWARSIMTNPGDDSVMTLFGKAGKAGTCNDGGSLCTLMDGKYTCAPPSVQLSGRWDELDLDGDGVWTWEEVEKSAASLQCKYVVDPRIVYKVFVNFLIKREGLIWIHPELRAGKKITKAYFDYAAGDINMCGYRNTDMCSNVLKRGLFDAPLKHGTAPRVGTTIESAMNYCIDLLEPLGTCDRLLPSTYRVWKTSSLKQCGETHLSKFVYQHPGNKSNQSMKMTLLSVDYSRRLDFEQTLTTSFILFKVVIVMLYISAMVVELKDIWVNFNWCVKFPSASQFGPQACLSTTHENGETSVKIQGVTTQQRMMVLFITLFRLAMMLTLAIVGVVFLMKQTQFMPLLIDGIAMLFVMEIPKQLYKQLLRESIRSEVKAVKPMVFDAIGPKFITTRPGIRSFLWLLLVLGTAAFLVHQNNEKVARPLQDSLGCACTGEGETCYEADRFSYDFWYNYWKNTVPQSVAAIKAMQAAHHPETTPRATSLLAKVASRQGRLSFF